MNLRLDIHLIPRLITGKVTGLSHVVLEGKTGKSRISSRERGIKNAVEDGKFYFEEFRLET